jgi:hypothetical protein
MEHSYDRRRVAFTDISMMDAQHDYMNSLMTEVMRELRGRRYSTNVESKSGWTVIGISSSHRVRIALELLDNGVIRSGVALAVGSNNFPMARGFEWGAHRKIKEIIEDLMGMLEKEINTLKR